MPGRRKKAEEGGAAAPSEAAVTDEAFKELIKQAASGVGAGRGRGRGRFGQQRFQVTFGGFGDDRECGGSGGGNKVLVTRGGGGTGEHSHIEGLS